MRPGARQVLLAATLPSVMSRTSAWDDPPVEAVPDWDALAQPQPEYVFDQEVQW
jgi:hypothetical protein